MITATAATARIRAKLNPPPSGCAGSGIWICGSSCINTIRSFACFAPGRANSGGARSKSRLRPSQDARCALAADDEAVDQRIGQFGGAHARLHVGDVIRDTPEFHEFVFQIGDRETRARIAIARLTDGTWVEQ